MSFALNNSQQISIFDRFSNLTEREQKFVKKSWANTFASKIFPLIDEKKFSVLFCKDNGRPNAPINVIIGSLILKEMFGLSDEELVDEIILDVRYQYALHLTSCEEIPYSDRTPSRFRERLYKYERETGIDLLKEEIERLGESFTKLLKIHSNLKRMDSIMLSSNCKKMSRLELIYTVTQNLIKAVNGTGEASTLPTNLMKYLDESDKNSVCYRLKDDEVSTRLENTIKDAMEAYALCGEAYSELDEYKLMKRMLYEQTDKGILKENKAISADCLQNPSDPDATYRKKAGKQYTGYVGNFVEDCSENGNIITSYDVKSNNHSDMGFCKGVIDELGEQTEKTTLIADGAYASNENFELAEENNIALVATNLTGKTPDEIIADFVVDNNTIEQCPGGHTPIDCKYDEKKGAYRAHFDKETCRSCPLKDRCPSIQQKKTALVRVARTTIQRAKYVKKLGTDEYKEYAKKRNGVEGIPSVLRRKYGVDNIPVRGLVRTKMWFGFKIGAINVKRVIAAVFSTKIFDVIYIFNGFISSFFKMMDVVPRESISPRFLFGVYA